MKPVILAGGLGTHENEETLVKSKPFLSNIMKIYS